MFKIVTARRVISLNMNYIICSINDCVSLECPLYSNAVHVHAVDMLLVITSYALALIPIDLKKMCCSWIAIRMFILIK